MAANLCYNVHSGCGVVTSTPLLLCIERADHIMNRTCKIVWLTIMTAFVLLISYMLFHNLGKSHLIQTDEAYHATNAYEMFRQGNWIVNTYRNAVDYFNSKPPLCLDCMILSYKLFGVNAFAARFPSAVFGLITCISIIVFFFTEKNFFSAVLFPLYFGACSVLFTYHMYRAAEMDALFNLFFVLAMISLYKMSKKHNYMYLYGLSLGLAFMCKGPHAALIFIIGLLYIPRIRSAFTIKRTIISVLLALIIPVIWIADRYRFDGAKLFEALFLGEVVGRASNGTQNVLSPLKDFFTSNIAIIFTALVVILILLSVFTKTKGKIDDANNLKAFLSDNYLFAIWAVVPVLFFSVSKGFNDWYIYTSLIALCMLSARLAEFCITKASACKLYGQIIVGILSVALALFFMIPTIRTDINLAGMGGHPVDQFTQEAIAFKEKWGEEYSGANAYLISYFRVDESVEDHWEPEYVAPAEMYLDVIPVDGTVEDFLNDPDAILFIDKRRWDEFSPILAGHVILWDDSYIVFSNDMY
ncbi:ArnT family glycosyltransferase [Butyrivibrio sp. VCB2001]|uniref:ArnT family glycosyltransferase n=1 Tax=Butyrivibrio sp. VCB2001 TaxID=1280667 RepID=UPI0018CB06EB|nr:glycosyltransferase family 39 protein [Butyrivibrio sp. VCB2001]